MESVNSASQDIPPDLNQVPEVRSVFWVGCDPFRRKVRNDML